MIEEVEIKRKIMERCPESEVKVVDLTGTKDHFRLTVIWDGFVNLTQVARHKMIYQILSEEMRGPIHALSIETFTNEEVENKK
jgi:stress-induced morphogen